MGRTAAKLSLLSALFLCPALTSQTPGSVEGVVVDSKTGVPLAAVSVYFGSDKGPSYETQTNPSGQFRIPEMVNGDYGCHFEKSGYIPQYSGSLNSPLKPVHVAAGQDPVRLTVSLASYAKLRGRVLDPEGKPVANARLTLGPLEETANDQGQFAFSQIAPGAYSLKAAPEARYGYPPRKTEPSTEERTALLATWYPSVTQADLAEPIVVRGGDDLSGIDIRLRSLPVYRVRGRVLDADGKPLPLASIVNFSQADLATSVSGGLSGGKPGQGDLLGYFTLYRSPVPSPDDGPGALVRDGSFDLAAVPRGLRQFQVSPIAGVLRPLTTVSVVVDHDIDDLEIRFEPTMVLDASLELANTPVDQTPAAVRSAAVGIIGSGTIAMRSKRAGSGFHFENVAPGEIRVEAPPGLAGGYYLSSVTLGGQDITWKPVIMQAGAPAILVTYKPNAGTVTGTVESADASTVVLIPQAALDAVDVQYGRSTPLQAGGAFGIGSLAPGSYYAFAVDKLQPDRLANPTVARRIAASASLVSVTEGAAISIKPPLVRLDD